jgi:hypothetical protein
LPGRMWVRWIGAKSGILVVDSGFAREVMGTAIAAITEGANMDLGAFSVSLTVKDLEVSRSFYE